MEKLLYRRILQALYINNVAGLHSENVQYYKMSHHLYYLIEQNEQYKHLLSQIEDCDKTIYSITSEELKNITADFLETEPEAIRKVGGIQCGRRDHLMIELRNDYSGYNQVVRNVMKDTKGSFVYRFTTDDGVDFTIQVRI